MSEQIGVLLVFAGLCGVVAGTSWLAWRAISSIWHTRGGRRFLAPSLLVLGGLAVGGVPFAYQHLYLMIVGLGERERVIDGERYINLTGWDREGYQLLTQRPDVVVLEMANPDVTDATLALLTGLPRLRELTLNDSAVTDAGLATLAQLPALETLRLARTKITEDGMRTFLEAPPPRLMQRDVSGLGKDPRTGLVDLMGTVATKAAGGLLSGALLDEAWQHVNAEVAAHFLDRYRELLGRS